MARNKSEIESLYDKKIQILLDGRTPDELSERELFIFNELQTARMFDPRYEDVYFEDEADAQKSMEIREKLEKMTDQEFLISDYPFNWAEDLPGSRMVKVIDQNKIKRSTFEPE